MNYQQPNYNDQFRQMMMSMFMISNVSQNNSNGNSQMGWGIIYRMAAITIIERIISYAPTIISSINTYLSQSVKNASDKMIRSLPNEPDITSTIEFHIPLSSLMASHIVSNPRTTPSEPVGEAIIDYATNLPNIKKVAYTSNTYIVNNNEPVCIDELNKIYLKLCDNSKRMSSTPNTDGDSDNMQLIEIYSYTMDSHELRTFINNIVQEYKLKIQNRLGDKLYYFDALTFPCYTNVDGKKDYSRSPPQLIFTMKPFVTNRRFSNVVGPESRVIQRRVEFFKQRRKWYDSKGIPYTLGLLLSGPPGGGKTSTIKCVSNELQRHIINIKLTDDLTKKQLDNLFFNETIMVNIDGKSESVVIPIDKRVYVFEDIDCQNSSIIIDRDQIKHLPPRPSELNTHIDKFIETKQCRIGGPNKDKDTENEISADQLSLSCLLNVLDGIIETPGRVIIMTSNYPDKLDKALIRPGRIDLICEFRRCDANMIIELLEKFYDVVLTIEEIETINLIPNEKYTPAELTKIMFENFDDYHMAIEHITTNNKYIAEDNSATDSSDL